MTFGFELPYGLKTHDVADQAPIVGAQSALAELEGARLCGTSAVPGRYSTAILPISRGL